MATVKLRYSAPSNITFHGEVDTRAKEALRRHLLEHMERRNRARALDRTVAAGEDGVLYEATSGPVPELRRGDRE